MTNQKSEQKKQLIGPFAQLLPMDNLPLRGKIKDEQLEILTNAGVLYTDGIILEIGDFDQLQKSHPDAKVQLLEGDFICLPGMVDAHTHICWGGTRSGDYAMRLNGKSYLEIAQAGGGIWSTVLKTRAASVEELADITATHAEMLFEQGITTIEVKSGYGLSVEDEIKMLEAIQLAGKRSRAQLIPTCLAAHMKPRDFEGSDIEYLQHIVKELLPVVKERKLANRVDIFTEKSAFSVEDSRWFLSEAKKMGFEITIHGDQFSNKCATLAAEFGALSIDHLEYADEAEITILAKTDTVAVALPGASIGLGERFAPARQLLDAGCSLAIATDWNPGSAPMGNLIAQAAILGTFEKLSMAETWAALTFRAAKALNINDIGILRTGLRANMMIFRTADFRDILYRQGEIRPEMVISSNIKRK